jgi:hypothetical protein
MSEATMRIPSLINRAAVKRHLLEVAHAKGRTRFTRVVTIKGKKKGGKA